jgi:hypothetical protein
VFLSADYSLVCLDTDERMPVGGLPLCGVLWCGAHPYHSLALPDSLLVSESFVACLLKKEKSVSLTLFLIKFEILLCFVSILLVRETVRFGKNFKK